MDNEKLFTHLNEKGRARMVDVGGKQDTHRIAIAEGEVIMKPETLALIKNNLSPINSEQCGHGFLLYGREKQYLDPFYCNDDRKNRCGDGSTTCRCGSGSYYL